MHIQNQVTEQLSQKSKISSLSRYIGNSLTQLYLVMQVLYNSYLHWETPASPTYQQIYVIDIRPIHL